MQNDAATPMSVYMARVKQGLLTEDEYQKKVVASLDRLNAQLLDYRPPVKGNVFYEKVTRKHFTISVFHHHTYEPNDW